MKKEYLVLIGLGVALIVVLGFTVGPFMATGVPGVLIREIDVESVSPGSAVSFVDSWSRSADGYVGASVGSWSQGTVLLQVSRKCDIEVTPIKWVAQDKPFNALFNKTADKQEGYNMTVYPNRYSFGIRYSLHYEVHVTWTPTSEGKVNPFAPSIEDRRRDLVTMLLQSLISSYDTEEAYINERRVFLSIDAPTLGADRAYALNPNYIGVMDAYLMSVEYAQPTKGWAGAFVPKDTATPLDMFASIDDARSGAIPLWHADTPTLLQPDEVYWYEKYAPAVAFFKTEMLTFGSLIQFDNSKDFPNWWTLQFEKEGGADPRATQWFRVDLGFKTSDIYDISGIDIPEQVKQQVIQVVIPTIPNEYPYPTAPTASTSWLDLLGPIYTIIIVIIIVVMVILIVYIVVNKKYGKK